MGGECINLIAGTEMTGPVALNDREQTGHLNKKRLVGHSDQSALTYAFAIRLSAPPALRSTNMDLAVGLRRLATVFK
jgi:hypothetical protein